MKLFSRHYGTERFFIMIALCFALLVGLSFYGGAIEHQNNKAWISSTPVYTQQYTWSRTGSQGQVVGMFTDTSKSAAFVLLKNDASTSSATANSYQVFLSGRDEKLQNNPSLTVFSYGPTGYVGLYFKDAAGFRNMVYSLIIRNDSAASDNANENTFDPNAERDQSFRDHNQIRLYLNFGADGVQIAPIMDLPSATPLQLFMDMPAAQVGDAESPASKFSRNCATAQGILAEMSTAYMQLNQLRTTISEMGVEVPDLPYYIAGDRIDTVPNDFSMEPTRFESEMLLGTSASGSGTEFLGSSGQGTGTANNEDASSQSTPGVAQAGATYTDDEGIVHNYYYFHTDYLAPGDVNFTWQGAAFSDGFINRISGFSAGTSSLDGMYKSYAAWRSDKKTEYTNAMPMTVKYDSWRNMDGTYVDMTKAGDQGIEATTPNNINQYVSTLNSYLNARQRYFTILDEMLAAENEVQALSSIMTSNDGKAVQNLWTY